MESKKDYECAICMNFMAEPVKLQCSHNFCKYCLDLYFEDGKDKKWPMWRQKVDAKKISIDRKLIEECKENFKDDYDQACKLWFNFFLIKMIDWKIESFVVIWIELFTFNLVKQMKELKLENDKKLKIIIRYGKILKILK